MKTYLMGIILLCFSGMNVALFAQDNQSNDKKWKENFEQFKAEREEFISKAMNLTEDESKNFWTLCNELQMKKFELNKALHAELRKVRQAKRDNKTVSDADYKKIVELNASVKVKEAQLDEEYVAKFLKVVSAEKVYLYQHAERQFANKMFGQREKREK
ncbi:MAG: hypothetical protein LBH32_14990 [Dysgonamonadaceae bacterium]|jgi:hypothetical protein|nr:hypothetical protein [Dysgonamonadaceae bacterium]